MSLQELDSVITAPGEIEIKKITSGKEAFETPARGINSILENFRRMAQNPVVARLRQPGKIELPFVQRARNIRIRFGKDGSGLLAVVRRENGEILFKNAELNIRFVDNATKLINLVELGQMNYVAIDIGTAMVRLNRKDLKECMIAFDLIKK